MGSIRIEVEGKSKVHVRRKKGLRSEPWSTHQPEDEPAKAKPREKPLTGNY